MSVFVIVPFQMLQFPNAKVVKGDEDSLEDVAKFPTKLLRVNELDYGQGIRFYDDPKDLQFLGEQHAILEGNGFNGFDRVRRLQRFTHGSSNMTIGVMNNNTNAGGSTIIRGGSIHIYLVVTRWGRGPRGGLGLWRNCCRDCAFVVFS